ncbi:MAG: PEP-CTERM sorting domain-containing protein [Chromatiales bacterium]|nr:PEP-CTERM sorting domain-containing protein [Chromatiales bacterium]
MIRPALVLAAASCLALATVPALAAEEREFLDFNTQFNGSSWLITGAGVTDAPAINVVPYPDHISFSSNGTKSGYFIPGASAAAFDGAWIADFSFLLPRRAYDVELNFSGLNADDRVVLLLNGAAIGNATIYSATGAGQHSFAPGAASQPFTFTQTTSGSVTGDASFIIGDKDPRGPNVLELSVNNTGTTFVGAPVIPLGTPPDGTVARVLGTISWKADYQIRPYPNPAGNLVDVDDDPHGWYNAVDFDNQGIIGIARNGWLTNRTGATLTSAGTIDNQGRFDIANSGTVRVSSGRLDNAGTVTVSGLLSVGARVQGSGSSVFTVNAGGTLEAGGKSALVDLPALENRGTVSVADSARVSVNALDNQGRVEVGGGGILTYFDQLNNQAGGLIDVQAGGLLETGIDLGRPADADSPAATNQGTLNVHGGTLNLARLDNQGQLAVLDGGSALVEEDLTNGASARLYVVGLGSRLQAASLNNQGLVDVTGELDLALPGPGVTIGSSNEGTITIGEGTTPPGPGPDDGGIGYGGVLTIGTSLGNFGSIAVMGLGRIDVARSGSVSGNGMGGNQTGSFFALNGGTLNINGTFDENSISCDGGIVKGRGSIGASAEVYATNGCSLRMGNSPGTLSILGYLSMDASSEIEVEIASPDDYDRLATDGTVALDGTKVRVKFTDGYLPDANDDFAWLTGRTIYGRDSLVYDVPYDDWQYGYYTDYGSGTATTHLQLAANGALNLGGGPQAGGVIGAGQVAYVAPPGYYPSYDNGGLLDNSGAVHNRAGAEFVNLGSLSAAPGSLANRAGAWFVNRGHFLNEAGAAIDNAGTFYNHATGVLDNQGALHNAVEGRFVNRGLLTTGGAATLLNEGHFENHGEVVNTGDIENRGLFEVTEGATLHGASFPLYSGIYTQLAGETRVNGRMDQDSLFIGAGRLSGNGQIYGRVYVGADGVIDPGNPGEAGWLSAFRNGVTLDGGTLHIDIASETLYDVLVADQQFLAHNATLEVSLLGGYKPEAGNLFDFLVTSGGNPALADAFVERRLPALGPDLAWQFAYLPDIGTLRLEVVAAVVPAPATLPLFVTGLAALAARARRRRR